MAQRKKEAVSEAILASAYNSFREKGYAATSISEIARAASVSPANIYVYFPSKLDVFLAVYEPWLREQIERMCAIAAEINDPSERIRFVLCDVWRDLPSRDNRFARSLVQALSTTSSSELCSRAMFQWAEQRVEEVILDAIPEPRRQMLRDGVLTRLIFLAFDGFVMKRGDEGPCDRVEEVIGAVWQLVGGEGEVAPTALPG
ncbi:MAG: TetR/AcrR family transcriptional regulator [Paracoccaceae bacterium]